MGGPVEDVLACPVLGHPARVHDQDVVGELGHHAEVVGDDDDRGAELLLQVGHQVEDLRLHGDIQGGGRLIGDQQLGVAAQRHGDHGTLAHAAGELMRVVVDAGLRVGDADPVQQLDRVFFGRLLAHLVVNQVSLGDLIAHGVVRVQGGQRILEDHRHLGAPQLAHPRR